MMSIETNLERIATALEAIARNTTPATGEAAEAPPKPDKKTRTAAKPAPEMPAEPAKAEQEPVQTEPAAPAEAAPAPVAEEPAAAEKTVTYADVQAAARGFSLAGGNREAAVAILTALGAKKLDEVKAERWLDAIAQFNTATEVLATKQVTA